MRALKTESEELGVMVKEGREVMESVNKVQKSAFHINAKEKREC